METLAAEKEIELSALYDRRFLTAIVASKLQSFYYYLVLTGEGVRTGGGFHTYPETIRAFLVPPMDDPQTALAQKRVIALVDRQLAAQRSASGSKLPDEQAHFTREIAACDRQIDLEIYRLYGLSAREIEVVESLDPNVRAEAKSALSATILRRLKEQAAYFSYEDIQAAVRAEKIDLQEASLRVYLSEAVKQGVIFDAGRGWYSRLEDPVMIDPKSVSDLVAILEKKFPLLDFSAWSTAQVNRWTHHLLAQAVAFVYAPADSLESIADFLERMGWDVTVKSSASKVKPVRASGKAVVLRPSIAKQPIGEHHQAPIEKILVDLMFENDRLRLMDGSEADQIVKAALESGLVQVSALISYAEIRGIKAKRFFQINQLQSKPVSGIG